MIPALLAALFVASLSTACSDDLPGADNYDLDRAIEFSASVLESNQISTRALDSTLVTTDPYNMDFHMEMIYQEEGQPKSQLQSYIIPTGQEGRLAVKGTQDQAFKWHGLTADHYFWGWTQPWEKMTIDTPWATPAPEDGNIYAEGLQPLTIKFYNSGEGDDGAYDKYKNNDIYETFIGTKRGPVDYYHNGQYVELTFHHLVSKIVVKRLTLYMSDGSIQNDVKGNITFLAMPDEATFYPHPKGDGWPLVVTTPNPNGELTYYIKSDPLHYDSLYVCPEINFRDLAFYIDITDERYKDYGDHGDYFGTFDNVKFIREAGTDFDQGNDEKILHAGEMMELNIELYPGLGPGMSVIIKEWNTERSGDAEHHSHPGIYTDSEASSFTTNADWANLFELYGETQNDEKVFNFYENVEIGTNTFAVGDGYVADGKGHLLKMKSSSNQVSVGPVRDIYITDGTNTVYIDENGYVYTVKNGVISETSSGRIPIPGSGLKKINLSTGAVS